MAYDVSQLANYTEEQNFPLLRKSILGSKTASLFTLQSGIKSSAALNIIDVDVVLQNDSVGSAVEGGGEVAFSQRKITVYPLAVREFFDPKVLNQKFLQSQQKAGSADDELAFEKEITDAVVEGVAAANEIALWRGDTTLTGAANVNLNKFDGFIKLIDASAQAIVITGNTASLSVSGIMATVDTVYQNIPVEDLDKPDMAIYMGRDLYRIYTTALKNANLFHYSVDGGEEFTVPGTTTKVYALPGLNTVKRIYAGTKSNFFIGCDLDGEEDSVKTVYLDTIEKVKMKIAYKYGCQVAFPERIVAYKAI